MHKKHIFLRVFSKTTIFACVFCAFFISPVFATLPAGYTELEYIESTGTQYIDTEYDLDTNNLTIKTKIREIGSKTGENDICGNQDNTSNRFVVGYYGANSSFAYNRSRASQTNATIDLIRTNDNEITYVYDGSNQTKYIIVNGIKGSEAVFSQAIYPSSSTIKIFQDGRGSYFLSCQMKYLQLISDDILVRNFIPAKRNSDGEVGMYDTVTNTFFTNKGTGDFIAGPVAEIKIATTKMVDEEFAAAEANLATTVQTIESVVSRTIAQTEQIQILQNTKQTRPDESCPANMKCLLVQDEDGTPHWYPIIEP